MEVPQYQAQARLRRPLPAAVRSPAAHLGPGSHLQHHLSEHATAARASEVIFTRPANIERGRCKGDPRSDDNLRAEPVLCDAWGSCDGIGERHADSLFRPQDDHRASFDTLAWSQLKIVFSEQITQNHEDLQHRVISADTASRAAPERKVGEGCAQLLVWFGETLCIEVLGILPVARSMVRTVHIHDDHRSAGYDDVAYAVVRYSHAV